MAIKMLLEIADMDRDGIPEIAINIPMKTRPK
ncbi:hypothetical protein PS941_04804 [Pseudomonas fluorescens]|jgi:hypothetical protein|uniref:Uncharacterized protein n=1 Tax=Pseudomonas fluorescens TaxID=294 RepID=A0A5E7VCB6_PSEFL|nr:hypothetical protein PS941_04804 [Pseudomonas fluorescens]